MQPCCSHHIVETMMQSFPLISVAFLAFFRYCKRFDQTVFVKAFRKTKAVK
jgi:hypothetical protein